MANKYNSKFVTCISAEIIILLGITLCQFLRLAGTEFTQTDIIFTILVLGIIIIILAITVVCFLCYKGKESADGKLRISRYHHWKYSQFLLPIHKKYGSDCAICLQQKDSDSNKIVQLSCNHEYHSRCIKTCFVQSSVPKCPTCRQNPKKIPFPLRMNAYLSVFMSKYNRPGKGTNEEIGRRQEDVPDTVHSCETII